MLHLFPRKFHRISILLTISLTLSHGVNGILSFFFLGLHICGIYIQADIYMHTHKYSYFIYMYIRVVRK